MLRFATAGESHGEALVALLSGMPAGVPVDESFLSHASCGVGSRAMAVEAACALRLTAAHILSGVRHGATIGAPITMTIANRDWKNWEEILPVGCR